MAAREGLPDLARVLGQMKDFQRRTVDYVFDRLYHDPDGSRRFLVADEVGLGKTLVARGVIARTLHHLWGRVRRIDIVYICSNADIARQNINRLNVTGHDEVSLATRITLLPITISNLTGNRVNFVSFTPGTSFELKSSLGVAQERALLYWLLVHAWGERGVAMMNVFQGHAGRDSFRERVAAFRRNHTIDPDIAWDFANSLKDRILAEEALGRPTLRQQFEDLCGRFSRYRERVPAEDTRLRNAFVGELREILASTCLRALEPDLVILDEFQRFRHLLEGEDEASQLARELFEYADAESEVRVLLLSATPYKMYTISGESGEEDHYADLVRTLRFLQRDKTRTEAVEVLLGRLRTGIYHLGEGALAELLRVKAELEARLRRVMVRTERLSVSADRDGMLGQVEDPGVRLEGGDIHGYLELQRVVRLLEQPDALEYWKSASYLLNFMDAYVLKRAFSDWLESPDKADKMAQALRNARNLLLDWDLIEAYRRVDPANARLRGLVGQTTEIGAWKLLWIAPSLPYHGLAGPYAETALRHFTKRLVFSAWKVVPKVVSVLLSYEAERHCVRAYDENARNTPEENERRRRSQLLRFGREAEGRLRGMPVLALIYPCLTFAERFDPLRWSGALHTDGEPGGLSLAEMRAALAWEMREALAGIAHRAGAGDRPDQDWYWAAPLLMDARNHPEATQAWFSQERLPSGWSGLGEGEEDAGIWEEHVETARAMSEGRMHLGPMPEDLAETLVEFALAAPAVAAMRALSRITGGPERLADITLRNTAGQVGWAFRNLFNHPEVMALLRGLKRTEVYWRRVLDYCSEGCLQAVLDEYAHNLRESLGLIDAPATRVLNAVAEAIRNALALRPSLLGVDRIEHGTGGKFERETRRMPTRFALPFGDEREEEAGASRGERVREAFNSPFWPFVLVSTSVGQEGLDFHPYCHAIVHWNLPGNPVDMEQREGRVHRYKGHAVRKNLALRHGADLRGRDVIDPWADMFERAQQAKPGGVNDLVPFWIYPVDGGARIERYVPSLPLSRDRGRLATMQRSLAVYRMVFGQPRQEDLLAFLLEHMDERDVERLVSSLQIDLSPPVHITDHDGAR